MRILTVPREYRTPHGTRFKARANEYANALRIAAGEATESVWVLHMDDDTAVGPDTGQALVKFISQQETAGYQGLHLAQEVLTYPRELAANRLTWLTDAVRPGCDISLFAVTTGNGSPVAGYTESSCSSGRQWRLQSGGTSALGRLWRTLSSPSCSRRATASAATGSPDDLTAPRRLLRPTSSGSGNDRWLADGPCERERADAELTETIRQIHRELRGDPGVRRVWAELVVRGVRAGTKRIWRLMAAAGLSGRHPRAWKRTTIAGRRPIDAPDLIGGGLHRRGTQHALVRRHHLRGDRRRLGLHRDRDRPTLPQGGRLRRR